MFCGRECSDKSKWELYRPHSLGPQGERKEHPLIGKSCKIFCGVCIECGKPFVVSGNSRNAKSCSAYCKHQYDNKRVKENVRKRKDYKPHTKQCIICNKIFITYNKRIKCCSESCSKRNERIYRNINTRIYRAKRRNYKAIDIRIVFKESTGRCQICNRKLNLKTKYPHPRSCSIDHIVPISCGGVDEYYNIQLACFKCNYEKGNRTVETGEQLKLPISI